MEWWPHGIEQGPDGAARQLPERHVWASSIWVARDGVARRRWWNPVERWWHWDEQPLPLIIMDGRMGYHAPQWVSVERAICMAWRRREPDSPSGIDEVVRVRLVDRDDGVASSVDDPMSASSLRWAEEEKGEPGAAAGERWKALKGRIGAIPIAKGYAISSHGRLRDPHGRVTSGLWAFGRRWAAVAGAGMLDLHEAAGLDGGVPLPLSIRQARGALLAGASPEQLAQVAGVSLATAWSYVCRAAPHVEPVALRAHAEALVPSAMWVALERLEGRKVVGGPLSELWEAVAARLPPQVRRDAHAMSALRLARTALAVG